MSRRETVTSGGGGGADAEYTEAGADHPRNYLRISAHIVPQDQCEATRPGIIISHCAFTTKDGQGGYVIISHTTQRAGICYAEGRSKSGRWSDETGTITTDGERMYNRVGEPLFAVGEQGLGQSEALP